MFRGKSTKVAGFSTVELMIAVAILVIGVAGIFDQFLVTRDASRRHTRDEQVRLLAGQRLAELRVCPYQELKAWQPPAGFMPFGDDPRQVYKTTLATRGDGAIEITISFPFGSRATAEKAASGTVPLASVKGERYP